MVIRVNTEELSEFNSVLKTIKNNLEDLTYAMGRVINNITYGEIIPDTSIITDVEKLNTDINSLKHEIECYIHDVNLISEEFTDADLKTKESTVELQNMIHDLLTKSKNSFIPATYSINSSISSDENEKVLSMCGLNEKVNVTVDLTKYDSI